MHDYIANIKWHLLPSLRSSGQILHSLAGSPLTITLRRVGRPVCDPIRFHRALSVSHQLTSSYLRLIPRENYAVVRASTHGRGLYEWTLQ